MITIRRLALKYLIIGVGAIILRITLPAIILKLVELSNMNISNDILVILIHNLKYSEKIILGLFILFDALKITKNKATISILGFCLPIIGVCFLMVENYFLQKKPSK